jgi:flagellar hook-basal body complex protein FliE
MNPLDALSALTQVQLPSTGVNFQPTAALPTAGTSPISEGFQNLLQSVPTTPAAAPLASVGSAGGPSTWGHMMQQMVLDVNSKQATAAQKVSDVLQGGPTPVHEAMVASEEASLSFEFLAEMRNKIVESYQTVMQMQV